MPRTSQQKSRHRAVALIVCFLLLAAGRLATALEPSTRLSQYAHEVWRFGDAGLLGTPQSLTQTTDGYIWLATSNGLFRFDGVAFTRWTPPPGELLPSTSMWYAFGARNGSLYVGTDLGLLRITDGHVHTYPGSPRWPGPFLEDSFGNVWMGVSGVDTDPSTLCKVGSNHLDCVGTRDGFDCARGVSNTIDADGYLWVGGTKGICRWKPGVSPEFDPIPVVLRRKGLSSITSLASRSDGSMWAGTQLQGKGGGLLHLANGDWNSYVAPGVDGGTLSVSALYAVRNSSLWIGTTNAGLYRLANGHLDHFTTADGLSNQNVLSIFQDHEGGVWVVTPMGVDYFHDYAVLTVTANQGFLSGHAVGVAADHRGSVFFASSILARLRNGILSAISDAGGKPLTGLQFLFAGSNDDIWLAAAGRLSLMKGENMISSVWSNSEPGAAYIDYITEDAHHDIWAAVQNLKSGDSFLIQVRNARVIGKYDATSVLGNQVINALAPNPAGGLWVGGSAHGLFCFHDGRFSREPAGGFDGRVENLMEEPGGALWIVTQPGFLRYQGGGLRSLTAANGLPCDSAVNIQDDGHGSKWFYLHCGVVRLSDAALASWWHGSSATVKGTIFDAFAGARPNLSSGSPAQTPDGHLWSANDYGFQVIDRHRLPFNSIPPPVVIEKVVADGKVMALNHDLIMPLHTQQIEVDYAGLSFLVPELVRFRYRLQGHDKYWIDAEARREAFYNDLNPGRYVFHVVACNNDGVWNTQGVQLAFTILPAWYQTTVFRSLMILLIVTVTFLAYLYRMRSYGASLKLRFEERLLERTRLARDLHDTLLQTIQGSKMVVDDAREHVGDPRLTGHALERLSEWLDRASAEGRAALEALRRSSIESNDLAEALRQVAEDCNPGERFRVNFDAAGSSRELHPIARDEIYSIGYEAIRNVCAHSGATELWILLEYKRRFRLEIRDNGVGIDEEVARSGKPGHFGLAGMRERASGVGGRLHISGAPQGGAVVSLVVPGQAIYENPIHGDLSRLLNLFRSRGGPWRR
jgi:signal transduction histidine kinase/ligand-binding sensor domain-containing protein